ncbi:MAG: GTPase HflX [Chloroflexi bacterium]|nr:MAG: GTPase HflX [Chloroflexota bacterium]
MITSEEQQSGSEKAILVGVGLRGERPLLSIDDSLRELALLAKTAGIEVVGEIKQILPKINSATFIGPGKIEEVIELLEYTGAKVVLFDDELSPRHQRELEKRFGEEIKVLDRSALILDIFAQHAKTREGALQVELAQYEYRLPRLTRLWTHLARQAGGSSRGGISGVGVRGPGETQLEVDRREIQKKIDKLKQELELVRQHRSRYRARRQDTGIPVIALVGYTNAGKSTLLNKLTGADVYAADQLFATLDPTTRRIELPSGRSVLLTDTVGFIQKLPPTLIAAFRATLEEIREADVILHVVDTTHSNCQQHIEAVEDTLAEIDVHSAPKILVWNKLDALEGDVPVIEMGEYTDVVAVSAYTGEGIDELLEVIEQTLTRRMELVTLCLPHTRGDLVALLYDEAHVMERSDTEDGVMLSVQLPQKLYERYKAFIVD